MRVSPEVCGRKLRRVIEELGVRSRLWYNRQGYTLDDAMAIIERYRERYGPGSSLQPPNEIIRARMEAAVRDLDDAMPTGYAMKLLGMETDPAKLYRQKKWVMPFPEHKLSSMHTYLKGTFTTRKVVEAIAKARNDGRLNGDLKVRIDDA